MKLFGESTQRTARLVPVLCLLVTLTQCSPSVLNPPPGVTEWGLAAIHDNVSLLSDIIGGSSESPAWSPDGAQIAFEHMEVRFAMGGIDPDDIYLVNSDGTEKRRLTQGTEASEEVSCHDPAWAPDSRRLVCACSFGGDSDLYILDFTAGTMTQLTDYPEDEADPAWSPDGTHIAFEWLRRDTTAASRLTSGIYIVRSDGHNLKRLTTGPYDIDPAWSPDSQRLSFTSSISDKSRYPASERGGSLRGTLCIIGVDGSELTCKENAQCDSSTWSPDGSLIACASASDIVAVQADGGDIITLLHAEYYMHGLSWSPDGTKLVFAYGPLFQSANDLYVLELP